jgi:hypothetical protein
MRRKTVVCLFPVEKIEKILKRKWISFEEVLRLFSLPLSLIVVMKY